MIDVKEYDLPDAGAISVETTGDGVFAWQPGFFCIVLGQANRVEDSLHTAVVERDGVPVYRRPSGGEAVILSPRMLVISAWQRNQPLRSPALYFTRCNERIIAVLQGLGVGGVGRQGISDICIGDRKILGSAIYRSKDLVWYHGVLNVAEPAAVIGKYLQHPGRQPDYRAGRPHHEFVTSLVDEGYDLSTVVVQAAMSHAIVSLRSD